MVGCERARGNLVPHRGIFSEPLLVDNDLALDFLSLDFFIFKDNLLDLIPDEGPELLRPNKKKRVA